MQVCVVFVSLPISTQKQKINCSKACNPLHEDYKKCLSADVQFTFMQSYTTPGEELKSCLTEEMGAESEYRQLAEDCLILFFHTVARQWIGNQLTKLTCFYTSLLLSACLRFFHCYAHFPQSVCPCKLGLLKADPGISG